MGKKRRNSILRRPDSAAGEAMTENVAASNAAPKTAKPRPPVESDKENQVLRDEMRVLAFKVGLVLAVY